MERDKRNKKGTGKGKLKKIVLGIICLAIVGAGVNFYFKYLEEKKKQMELAEKQRQEELEKERQRKFLEEKRKEFERLVAEMKRYYEAGDFEKAREIGYKALGLAKQYGFNTDEIYKLLHLMKVAEYRGKLKELEELNRDIYKYFYVREEVLKIPVIKGLGDLRDSILIKTYENEYLVNLILAKKNATKGMEAENPLYYYLISRDYLDKAIAIRKNYRIPVSSEEEIVRYHQRELFFYSEKVREETVPSTL
ncbi:MAG: hypothetical protein NC824_00165 [Candidatus Omnitrophica bacterium]|nr:hypothetical protein [Candidatus Omnitrophota bacterium]